MESALVNPPSSRRGTKKVLRWLENHVTTDFCDCCHKMNVAFCLNNSITSARHERPPVCRSPTKRGDQYPRFQRDSVDGKIVGRASSVFKSQNKVQTTPTLQTSSAVSVSSAHELKTYTKKGYRCTLC